MHRREVRAVEVTADSRPSEPLGKGLMGEYA
jgi:hypothetical protein